MYAWSYSSVKKLELLQPDKSPSPLESFGRVGIDGYYRKSKRGGRGSCLVRFHDGQVQVQTITARLESVFCQASRIGPGLYHRHTSLYVAGIK